MEHLPKIVCTTIPQKSQRYETAGDYFKEPTEDAILFRVSKMTPDAEFSVFIHECIEWYLTQKRGIEMSEIDSWDMEKVFYQDPKNSKDPGKSKKAPYYREHKFATKIEKLIVKELGLNWKEYDKSFDIL